jgi:uncharacterized protein DUF397
VNQVAENEPPHGVASHVHFSGRDAHEQACRICLVDLPGATWSKSTRSGYHGNCVEVAPLGAGGLVAVRDSKDGGHGPVLVFSTAGWSAFVAGVKQENP